MSHPGPERPAASNSTSSRRRWLRAVAATVVLCFLASVVYLQYPWPLPPATAVVLVSHRGVHQTFPLAGLENDTCTAAIIHPPTHTYLENTLPSIAAAIAAGANVVELDVHRTADSQLVVFHDWTLECRTNGTGVTNQQDLADLQRLDVGYGYTPDSGASYPLRGLGVGLMPSLPQVLAAFPETRFVLDDKDGDESTLAILSTYLASLAPRDQARVSYWGTANDDIHSRAPGVQPYLATRAQLRACLGNYLAMLITGSLSEGCREQSIGIPFAELSRLPGWPHLILARAHQAGVPVFITDVDTAKQLQAVITLPVSGIQTNRIEVIGPLVAEHRAGDTETP